MVSAVDFNKLIALARMRVTAASQPALHPATRSVTHNATGSNYNLSKLAALVEKHKPDEIILPAVADDDVIDVLIDICSDDTTVTAVTTDNDSNDGTAVMVLHPLQEKFIDTVLDGQSVVLIGAAGTGKTTSMRSLTRKMLDNSYILPLTDGTKHLKPGSPGMVILSFTRKAVNNIRRAVVDELKPHTITCHKLLEFSPVFYEIDDPANPGFFKKTMRFEPARNKVNPLPASLSVIAYEESSTISTELYDLIQDALPSPKDVQEIFLGDIQQLPPIFGSAILGFKMLSLPVVELTEIYRQALDSPIISLAHKLLSGNTTLFEPDTFAKRLHNVTNAETGDEVKFTIWGKKIEAEAALIIMHRQLKKWIDDGEYDPYKDMILCPFNKSFGTIELNKYISQYMGDRRGAIVHEVIAGFNTRYLAVGDRVLYDKEDAIIISIRHNGTYLGKMPVAPSAQLDRWGEISADSVNTIVEEDDDGYATLDKYMETMSTSSSVEERVNSASHVIEVRYTFQDELDDTTILLSSAAEINDLLGGHVITVHKFQGSEEAKVFLLLHHSHSIMVSRELLYTAITRARNTLYIVCEKDTFYKGIKFQKIKGNTIAEKAEFFKGRV